jgi:Flp pilus assembly protein TadD
MAEAKRYLKEASRLNPASPTIYEHLGDVYLKLGEEQSARLAWQKALNLSTDSEGTSRIRAKIAQKIDK